MAGAVAAAERCFEGLDLPADEGDAPGAVAASFDHRIEYRQVGFSYDGAAPVRPDVSLEVCRDQVLALAGPAGAGNATLVDLLPRFYAPTAGAIPIDGVPTRDRAARGPDRGVGRRADRRARQPRDPVRGRRPVPPVLRPAVPRVAPCCRASRSSATRSPSTTPSSQRSAQFLRCVTK